MHTQDTAQLYSHTYMHACACTHPHTCSAQVWHSGGRTMWLIVVMLLAYAIVGLMLFSYSTAVLFDAYISARGDQV